ncbi:cell division protein FtsI / penicillin-binding protein [Campylobacter corcagiensis]|nr:cell division protein FtsI / penicillin-binding protein [Campylobacter corcagiensis]
MLANYYWASSSRNLPRLESSDKSAAVRGSIISEDGYHVANSKKLYKVTIDTRSIDPDKLDLFVKLYSIYANDSEKRVKNLIKKNDGAVVLSYKIDPKAAMHLRELSRELNSKKVFISFVSKDGVTRPPIGMSVLESGESRNYLAKNSMSPFLGYVKKVEVDGITRVKGVKGVEKFYDYYLFASSDELVQGPRDIGNNIILEKDSIKSKKADGYNVILNTPLKFQSKIEKLLAKKAKEYGATEIVVGILDSKNSQVLTLASSNRYNPENITKNDYQALNITATEYPYEPGSVIKPIVFSLVYEKGLVNLNETIKTYNGSYKLGTRTIRDTSPYPELSAIDIVVKSSNIGMIMITSRLDNAELFSGLLNYNLSAKTGIDLPYEQTGNIPSLSALSNRSNKATLGYGYGLQTTFMQILNAFTVFNNDGILTTPRIVNHLEKDGKIYKLNEATSKQVISKKTADAMKFVLTETVNRGTGRKARTKGLEIGGKTGTARVFKDGSYSAVYNSSFFGFMNDQNRSYTMGVLVREPTKGSYYAAQNALPIFKEIIDMMINDGYLTPKHEGNFTQISEEELSRIRD